MTRLMIGMLAAGLVASCSRPEPPPANAPELAQPAALAAGDTAMQAVVTPETPPPTTASPAPARSAAPAPARPADGQPTTAAPSQPQPAQPTSAPAAPAATPAPPPTVSAEPGTEIVTHSDVEISTRRNKPGEQFTATVASAVMGADGRAVIPANAVVTYTIVDIKEAENKDAPGVLVLRPVSVAFDGQSYPIKADVSELAVTREGRGVTAGDAGKVAAGAAAGAILGKILTKKAGGAVVGGAVGAAAGTVIAVNSADKDLVIPAGARIVIRLTDALAVRE